MVSWQLYISLGFYRVLNSYVEFKVQTESERYTFQKLTGMYTNGDSVKLKLVITKIFVSGDSQVSYPPFNEVSIKKHQSKTNLQQ